jgi:hypothetical protein
VKGHKVVCQQGVVISREQRANYCLQHDHRRLCSRLPAFMQCGVERTLNTNDNWDARSTAADSEI